MEQKQIDKFEMDGNMNIGVEKQGLHTTAFYILIDQARIQDPELTKAAKDYLMKLLKS